VLFAHSLRRFWRSEPYSAVYFASALAEHAGAFSTEGETAPPSGTLWAAARDLCGRIECAELSQWLGLVALPSPAQIVKDQLLAQHYWADKVHIQLQKDLIAEVPLRDKVRLLSEGHKHAGAWLTEGDGVPQGWAATAGTGLGRVRPHVSMPIVQGGLSPPYHVRPLSEPRTEVRLGTVSSPRPRV